MKQWEKLSVIQKSGSHRGEHLFPMNFYKLSPNGVQYKKKYWEVLPTRTKYNKLEFLRLFSPTQILETCTQKLTLNNLRKVKCSHFSHILCPGAEFPPARDAVMSRLDRSTSLDSPPEKTIFRIGTKRFSFFQLIHRCRRWTCLGCHWRRFSRNWFVFLNSFSRLLFRRGTISSFSLHEAHVSSYVMLLFHHTFYLVL